MKSSRVTKSPAHPRRRANWTPMLFALVPLTVMLWVVPATAAGLQ